MSTISAVTPRYAVMTSPSTPTSSNYDEDKGIIHLSGNVAIETAKKGVLHCDEADYDTKSGDLKLKMNLAPAR